MQRPQPGSVIEVELEYAMDRNMIPPRTGRKVYRGEVLKSYRWLTDREFCMSGDDSWPIRVINLGNVVRMEFESGSGIQLNTQARVWEVTGSGGNRYLVSRDSQGWSCDCRGFQFRRNCRHITEISSQA
jgi:frataxin-like iron-binding protein CyaY